MSLQNKEPCCKESLAQGMAYCLTCGASLLPDETTVTKKKVLKPSESLQPAESAQLSNRSWYIGMIIACLVVFAAIVTADYFVQRKAARDALALATPSPAYLANPLLATPAPMPSPTPTLTPSPSSSPSPDEYDALLDDLFDKEGTKATRTSKPTPEVDFEKYLEPAPTSTPTPRPTPRATPQVEQLVSAFDVLSGYSDSSRDSRRYRFRIDGIARVKGSFSAKGGGVTVRIMSGGNTYYSSGEEVSADTIDCFIRAPTN